MLPSIACTTTRPSSSTCFSTKCCLSTAAATAGPPLNLSSSSDGNVTTSRRSGNYEPTVWSFEYIQSINNDFVGEKYVKQFNKLREEIKMMMMNVEGSQDQLDQLELINNLQRLGVSYHFKEEIIQTLRSIHQDYSIHEDSFYLAFLKFRLLRQHGFYIYKDILLDNFKDEQGNFNQILCEDIQGLLQLYEASFFSTENDKCSLEAANKFTKSHLKNYLKINQNDENNLTVALVHHALEIPLHWVMLRLEARWFIDFYERMPNFNHTLLKFAKLDFNIVQATYQEELRTLSRWWKSTCLAEKLPFSRDRLVENYFWAVGMIFQPPYGYCRKMLAKVGAIVTAIDDIYDIYGTLDELEAFTNVVERWDIKAMDQLPEYMKICYLLLFNATNETASDILKEQEINVLPYLTEKWTDLCKAYLQEARWYYNGYIPTLQEYMDNAWISIAIPLALVHAYVLVANPITKETLESLSNYPDIIRRSATIIRLVDDLETSSDEMKRGDVPKAIQCYMKENSASEEEARQHIKFLLKKTWKQMNKAQRENSIFSETFIEIAVNFARAAHCMYLHGDGHGIQNKEIINSISKILFEAIPIK